jgi:hypothetical protein
MKRALVIGVAAVAAAVLALAAAVFLPGRGARVAAAPDRPLAVRASFSPSAVEFGDPVTARVAVTLARPSSVRVVQSLAPLSQLGRTVEHRVERGGLTVVTFETPAACLSEACLASSGRRAVTPPPARVAAGGVRAAADWSPLTVTGRVTPADLAKSRPPFRADTAPPPVSYRVPPATLAALLDAAAAILAACAAGLIAAAVLRARRRRDDERTDELARALRLARDARERPEPDRRAAAGYVARLLDRDDELARNADDLAWSRPSPTPGALTDLVEDVERERTS